MQKENAVKVIIGRVKPDVKISCHAELVSASSTHVVSQRQQQRQAWKTLNQVQGDTPIFNNNGFTLIELLVVVLIIGILAAVALPQYQKAVWKSRNVQLKTLVATLGKAQQRYYIANGEYAKNFDELDIDIPLEKVSGGSSICPATTPSGGTDVRRLGKNFEVLLGKTGDIFAFWVVNPYKCGGFFVAQQSTGNKMLCTERATVAGNDNFCIKLEKATFASQPSTWRFYNLP